MEVFKTMIHLRNFIKLAWLKTEAYFVFRERAHFKGVLHALISFHFILTEIKAIKEEMTSSI